MCMTMHAFPANVPIPINVPPRISTQNIIIAPSYSGAVAIWVAYFRFCGRRAPSVFSSVLSCSRPRSDGWPHHERTFSIYPCPLSFSLTLPRRVLSTSWCCPSRPCVAFLAFVHLTLTFLALSLSPGNSLVSSCVAIIFALGLQYVAEYKRFTVTVTDVMYTARIWRLKTAYTQADSPGGSVDLTAWL